MTAVGIHKTCAYRIGAAKQSGRRNRIGRVVIVVWLGLFSLGAAGASAAGPGSPDGSQAASASVVTLRSAVTVAGSRIHLTDVIAPESTRHLAPNAQEAVLMDAPNPGNDRYLPGKWVAAVVRSKGRLADSVTVAAPDKVHVRRAHQTLSPERLEAFFYDYVTHRLPDSEFDITRMKVRGTDHFPVGGVALSVLAPEPREVTGRVNLRVRVEVGGEKFGWLTLSGWVDCYETVVCAGRYLSRGTLLEASDLESKRMNTSRMPSGIIREVALAVGKELRRNVKAGDYLRENMLTVPPLVQKGDKVKLVARSGNIKIVTFGIAKSDGGAGEQIRLENLTSKKIIVGRVKDASTVDVIF